MNRIALFVPLVVFAILSLFLLKGLDRDPTELPSALVGEAFPSFVLPSLANEQQFLSERDLGAQVVLVNVWATWCYACRIEHPMLVELSKRGVKIIGLNYKDQESLAGDWLDDKGDPYIFSIFDPDGKLGFDLGVYGAPETYLVDAYGIIMHKRVGVLDERIWQNEFKDKYYALENAIK